MGKSFLLWLRSLAAWLQGLLAAFIGAAANSITVTVVKPEAFNFTTEWRATATVALVSGIVSAAFYLAKSPVPVSEAKSPEDTQ